MKDLFRKDLVKKGLTKKALTKPPNLFARLGTVSRWMSQGRNVQRNAGVSEYQQRRTLICVMVINFAAFVIMLVGAWFSGSSTLLSGTLDNLGDGLSYALSLLVVGASALAKARMALLKGVLIMLAAMGILTQIVWSFTQSGTPIAQTMGFIAVCNLLANALCLWLLYPLRNIDVNMRSMWACTKNDVAEATAVIAAAVAVWLLEARWPDLAIALLLLGLFVTSAVRVLKDASSELRLARRHDLVLAQTERRAVHPKTA